ncbi:MAG: zinc ribbon domain-containing protein [Nitrospirae bacterium]|nr:zinc ribbon domain-containing protein [Nitrospirota bacterium]
MPIYEYECSNCGKHCEVFQKFNEEPIKTCPDCGGHMHKLISQTSFVLKGTGWYVTDYARAEKKKPEEKHTEDKRKPDTDKKQKAETSAKN